MPRRPYRRKPMVLLFLLTLLLFVFFLVLLLFVRELALTATHRMEPVPLLTHRVDSYAYQLLLVLLFFFLLFRVLLFVAAVLCVSPMMMEWGNIFFSSHGVSIRGPSACGRSGRTAGYLLLVSGGHVHQGGCRGEDA